MNIQNMSSDFIPKREDSDPKPDPMDATLVPRQSCGHDPGLGRLGLESCGSTGDRYVYIYSIYIYYIYI